MRGFKGLKEHWRPFRPLEWPAEGGRSKVLHTGHGAVCSTAGTYYQEDLGRVDCKRCLHLASRATFQDTGERIPCVEHEDCRSTPELGRACRETRPVPSNGEGQETKNG